MTERRKREFLSGWLWAMYERSCHEHRKYFDAKDFEKAKHYAVQAQRIGNLLAQMTRREHPLTR